MADRFAQSGETVRDFIRRDHLAVHPNSLAVGDEVRGGEEPGTITVRAADGIDHGADRAFAVGAGNVNDALIFSGDVQLAQRALDILEPELDPKALGSVKPGERLCIVHCEFEK